MKSWKAGKLENTISGAIAKFGFRKKEQKVQWVFSGFLE
jgi:hypothetical protein